MFVKFRCRNCRVDFYVEIKEETEQDVQDAVEAGKIPVDTSEVLLHRCHGETTFYPSGISDFTAIVLNIGD